MSHSEQAAILKILGREPLSCREALNAAKFVEARWRGGAAFWPAVRRAAFLSATARAIRN